MELVGRGASAALVARPHALFHSSQRGVRNSLSALNEHYVVEIWDNPMEVSGFNVNKEIKVYHYSEAVITERLEYTSIKPIVHQFKGICCMVRQRLDTSFSSMLNEA